MNNMDSQTEFFRNAFTDNLVFSEDGKMARYRETDVWYCTGKPAKTENPAVKSLCEKGQLIGLYRKKKLDVY